MKKRILLALSIIVLVQLACGPEIVVMNNTNDTVRLSITNANQEIALSSEPGDSQTINVNAGTYHAVVVPAEIWNNFARSERDTLMNLLDDPENMSKEQINKVVEHLSRIGENEKLLYKNVKGQSTCTNSISDKANGRIDINGTADSTLLLNCSQVAVPTSEP